MDNILVTGANGHVGFNITKLLVDEGYNVRASVRDINDKEKTSHLEKLGVQLVEADIMKPKSLMNAFEDIDGVFQVAAVFKTWAKNPKKEIIDPSVIGGINVLKAAKQKKVKKIIFTSGNVAMGSDSSPERIFTEKDWNNDAKSPYVVAKTLAEKKAWGYAEQNNLNMVSINPAAVIGPGFYKHTGSTEFFEEILRNKIPGIFPLNLNYVDARDVAKAHLLAYRNNDAQGRYLISGEFFTFKELLQLIKEFEPNTVIPKKEISLNQLKFFSFFDWCSGLFTGKRTLTLDIINETLGKHAKFSSQKAENELGWKAMDIKQSIKDTVSWVKQHFL